jgi:FkbM family methyltransferase
MTLYRVTRGLYQRVFNRSYWKHRQAQKELFRDFVRPQALVFDIGANRGEMSDAFLALGARVVAVEPNPALAEELTRHFGSAIVVEQAAVGAKPGRAELHVGRDHGHSTLSEEWLERAPTADRWEGRTVTTEVTTLDRLIEKHGKPDFVKIDVEAYEADVLSGLSIPLPAVCFEYQASYLEVAERCLSLLGEEYEYALTRGEAPALTTGWLDHSRALAELRSLGIEEYGDAFARRVAHT